MGVQLQYGTAGATGGGFSAQPGSFQPTYEERLHETRWAWQDRNPKTRRDPIDWRSLWSFGCRFNGGGEVAGMDGASAITNSMADADPFEPYSCLAGGNQTVYFLLGKCVDGSDVAVANAIVQVFRTSDDMFMGERQANLDGTFAVPLMSRKGVAHYVVAYKPGSPDIAGTSVNTLLSTNVDGT